jgi:hypothetical protein
LNPGRRGGKPVTNRLSYGTAQSGGICSLSLGARRARQDGSEKKHAESTAGRALKTASDRASIIFTYLSKCYYSISQLSLFILKKINK